MVSNFSGEIWLFSKKFCILIGCCVTSKTACTGCIRLMLILSIKIELTSDGLNQWQVTNVDLDDFFLKKFMVFVNSGFSLYFLWEKIEFLRFLERFEIFLDFLPTLFHSNKDVVRLIFEYIKMLQRLEPNKRYWKERIHFTSCTLSCKHFFVHRSC